MFRLVNVCITVILVVGVAIGWWLMSSETGMPTRHEPHVPNEVVEVRTVDDPEWIARAAAERTTIEFRSVTAGAIGDPPAKDKVLSRLESLGPLPDSERDSLVVRYRGVVRSTLARLLRVRSDAGSGPNGKETLSDLVEELEVQLMVRRQEAKIASLESGDYITVERENASKIRWPPGTLTSSSTTRHRIDGKKVVVVIGISPSNPAVAAAHAEVNLFRKLLLEQDIERFNALSYEVRRQRFEDHQAAVSEMSKIPSSTPEMERRLILEALIKRMLPDKWVIDPGPYYARVIG
jgi:hypothetical protein